MSQLVIREIQEKDNPQVKQVVQSVLVEMGVPKVGTAYEDKSLDDMYGTYKRQRMKYFVVAENENIIGGAGIAPLAGEEKDICELQKMYFLPAARGRGAGSMMMETCLKYAKSSDYKQCYLETLPYMEHARKLYARTGFKSLEKPLGNTGHYNCTIWMLKDI